MFMGGGGNKWSPDLTIKFVKEYVKREHLYNPNCSEYKSKYIRKIAFQEITQAMNIRNFGPTEVGNKIKNIRSTYSQELKKTRIAKLQGKFYVPNLAWFQIYHRAMQKCFANEDNDITMTYSVALESEENQDDSKNPLQEDSSSYSLLENETGETNEDNIKVEENTYMEEFLDDNEGELIQINKKKTRKRDSWEMGNDSLQSRIMPQISMGENEFDVFGKSVAAQLKNMPMRQALQAEKYIQNYLSNLRLQTLDE